MLVKHGQFNFLRMNSQLKTPVENFIKWEKSKGKSTFLIQPINGKNEEFSWERVGVEARKICNYIRASNFQKNQRLQFYQKIVHIGLSLI